MNSFRQFLKGYAEAKPGAALENKSSFFVFIKRIFFPNFFDEKKSDFSSYISFFFNCISHFKWLAIGQIFVAIMWAVDLSLRPYLIKVMLDKLPGLESSAAFDVLMSPATFYISMSVISACMLRFEDFIWLKLNSGLKCHISEKLMDKMATHSYTLYQNNFAGSLANKIKDVMSGVPDLSKILINKLFSHILALFIAIYTIWQANSIFAFTMIFWIMIYLTGSFILSATAKKLSVQAAEARTTVVGYMSDVLSNILNVWLFNTRIWEQKNKLSDLLKKYTKADQTRDWFFIKMYSFQSLSFIIYQIICLFWLISGLKNQSITPGDFALVLTLNISIVNCLSDLSNDIGTSAELIGNIMQGLQVTHSPVEIQDKPGAGELVVHHGRISFKDVHFSYKESKNLFKNLCITIEPGQKVGLVGYSGSGKSTFVNLILRLFEMNSGSILIDGKDIRDLTLTSLRNNFALIPQDPSLFHRTLMENIRYGNVDATDEEVIEASKCAHIDEFINTLPNAYNSMVGERGIKLSGGQRQRIAIARAILKNAPILILDEATSHLDSITEGYVQESLSGLMQNKTTIVIAHRLSTLLYMDRIIVFDRGEIVEDGKHEVLLNNGKLYKTLWDAQVGGFLPSGN